MLLNNFTIPTIDGVKLSDRETEILACLVCDQKINKQIAFILSISEKTSQVHISNILKKTGCRSREHLISWIKQSGKLNEFVRFYNQKLLSEFLFKKIIEKTAFIIKEKSQINFTNACWLIHDEKESMYSNYIKKFIDYFSLLGIEKIQILPKDKVKNMELVLSKEKQIPNVFIFFISNEFENDTLILSDMIELKKSILSGSIFIILGDKRELPKYFHLLKEKIEYIFVSDHYDSFLQVIKKIWQFIDADSLSQKFDQQKKSMLHKEMPIVTESIDEVIHAQTQEKIDTNYHWSIDLIRQGKSQFTISIFLCVISTLSFYFSYKEKINFFNFGFISKNADKIRSSLSIPVESAFLHRNEVVQLIETKLEKKDKKNTNDVSTIPLVGIVGIGGVGKTTIARYYARSHDYSLIWEISASTKQTIINSFEELAKELSTTKDEKEELLLIQSISNLEHKERCLMIFVKYLLKQRSDWLLIYDNVKKFSDINSYIPDDPDVWGKGRVVITTRDNNIYNTNFISANQIIEIGELKQEESLLLFCNILYNTRPDNLEAKEKDYLKTILKNIPSFPLDVATAAYYVKSSGICLEEYVFRLNHFSEDFDTLQEDVLKEVSFYNKTRYKIVSLTIKKVANDNKDFEDLLLFIGFLDCFSISRELLEQFKPKLVVDSFIHYLKKYSLVTDESILFSNTPSFSIHPSIHAMSIAFFNSKSILEKNNERIKKIKGFIENYVKNLIDTEDIIKMKEFLHHYEKYSDNQKTINSKELNLININLGCLNYFLGNYNKAKKYLENIEKFLDVPSEIDKRKIFKSMTYLGSIYWELCMFERSRDILEKNANFYNKFIYRDYVDYIKCMSNLGNVYRELGQFKKAKEVLEKNIIMCKKHMPETSSELGLSLVYLGNVYREQEKYELARENMEQGLDIYNKYGLNNHLKIAWTLAQIGNICKVTGDYEKAEKLLDESIDIYEKIMREHVGKAWALTYLGNVYKQLKKYDKAIYSIEKALMIYRKHFPENHFRVSWAVFNLSDVYKVLGDCEKAKNILEKHLAAYQNKYDENNFQVAQILKSLGQISLYKGQMDISERYLVNSLSLVSKRKKSSEICQVLEILSDLCICRSKELDQTLSKEYKIKAHNYLKQMLDIKQESSIKDLVAIDKINNKIRSLNQ